MILLAIVCRGWIFGELIGMRKRFVIIVIILLVIFGGTFGFDAVRSYFVKGYFATFQPPPVTVSTTRAKSEQWQPTIRSVGTLTAVNGVEVNSRVDGQVEAIYFKSGKMVQKDQPLVQLDDSIDRQTLKDNQAQLTLATLTYKRQLSVYKRTQGVSKSDVDTAEAKMLQMQAAVQTAKLDIQYKNIKAPFTGKIGIRDVNIGQYVTAGKALVSLQSLDPLFVDFSLTQQEIRQVKLGQGVKLTIDGFPGRTFAGTIVALNSIVAEDTRSLLVRANIPNKGNTLYPGIFANVQVVLPTKQNVVTIPQTAISYSLYGDTVFIVKPAPKDKSGKVTYIAKQQFVNVGDRQGDFIAITKGVKSGEQVVVSGQIKLHNGSTVIVDNKNPMKFNK